MVAEPVMVYEPNESVKQVSNLWTVKPIIPNGPEEENGRIFLIQILDRIGLSRGAQQLLINGRRFEMKRHYLYAMRTLPGIFTFGGQQLVYKMESKCAFCKHSPILLKYNVSLIFEILQITSTPTKLGYRAVLYCKIINGRNTNMWDIRQLFDYWSSRPDDKDLSDIEIQTKLASLLLSICFIRINKAAEINLTISNKDYLNQTAILCLSPKAYNSIDQYEIRKTGDPNIYPNSTLFTWLNHLYWHYWMDPEQIASLFWQPDGQSADKRRISLWLNSIQREIARQGLETIKLNIFTLHSVFSRAASNYYIYAANAGINDIASQLVGSHGQSYATQIVSQQRGGAIERNDISTLTGCYLQHSGNSTLSRSSIAQHLALPFYGTLPVGRGIEPSNSIRVQSDMIYINRQDNDDMSRQQDQWSSWNANELEH
ncbi:MAG: hypothetical protein EZS28_000222 [Streblomastix strix]|uniref:Uncharacterized protein n=1 Tax=Streblomastix strix TaxID=222440 RepID=A0A5J4XCI6_9EUKA|nr:MAG: hypothetical protein EZS28_000222 [Streblomastix strix]